MVERSSDKPAKKALKAAEPRLLTGGNPQIAKGYGEEPVKAWIAAAPGWKGDVAARIDAIVTKAIPGVKKAVKWNSPFYGVEEGSWFLCFHAMTKYVKVTFFQGARLEPQPQHTSSYPAVRYYHIHEGEMDEKQFTRWVKQASKLPGERV